MGDRHQVSATNQALKAGELLSPHPKSLPFYSSMALFLVAQPEGR
jgi:hypothetical protein